MEHLNTEEEITSWAEQEKKEKKSIALVPTMGNLHTGHLALIDHAKQIADSVVASIFVNPTQFGPHEDFEAYPRTLERDLELLRTKDIQAVFMPTNHTLYPEGFDTWIEAGKLGTTLCGASRPGHFRGVCTVVALLFQITKCDKALFGEKDFQQLQIIRRMSKDLRLGVEIVSHPIVREEDGLAMSSRNSRLSLEARKRAPQIFQALQAMQKQVRAGEKDIENLNKRLQRLLLDIPGAVLDYAAWVDLHTLQPLSKLEGKCLCAVALKLGDVRLIDNIVMET